MDRAQLNTTFESPVAFVDIETTGCTPGAHRVIDVAVIGATGSRVDFEWQSLVNPGVQVPAGITALTGIDNEMLAGAPPFERIARELRDRLDGRVFVAHNVRFDYGFIRREFAALGTSWSSPNLCTVRLSRALYPEMPRHNLDAVMERHDIHIENRHRAMPDAQALLQFWRKLRVAWPEAELRRAFDLASLRATLPAALPADLPDDLPEGPGVYRFFGAAEDGAETLIYVGKANNLRERVLDHFRAGASDAKARKLAAQVRRVQWTETAGELGALLLEAREVREARPVYNRRLRGGGERLSWLFDDEAATPRLTPLDAEALRSGNAYGSYRTERDARRALEGLAREHKWCFKLLGLESGAGSCFGLQVGRCNGACMGKESAGVHLARVKLGLMPIRLKAWPHEGPMMLREGAGERVQYHVIDGWQHLGSFDAGDEDAIARFDRRGRRAPELFDFDTYRMFTRLLRDRRLTPLPKPVEDSWT
ncbi:MAG TPA: exonuclease domain-containing protein [Steroidobacteraceae bacterium]|nr:exonuclease domain-containing protein [Steroidobacteraceae bacterium]